MCVRRRGRSSGGAEMANCRARTATRVKNPSIGRLGAREQAQDFILEWALGVLDCESTRAGARGFCRCSVENRPLRSLPAGMRLTCMQPRPGHLLGIWSPGILAGPPAQPMIGLKIATCAIHSLIDVQRFGGVLQCLHRIRLCPSPRAMHCDQPASGVHGGASSDSSPTEISLPTDARRNLCRLPGQPVQTPVRRRDARAVFSL
jgi:hypothetical protein